ncbi:MAG: Lrp/AsnC family transcriptional regulator [Agrococcus casei]|uniref:Lrp/AsnC family transcriptional regulator n=1 Tax=Agrococcus casei TaxID=343512 RepID=UPI003F9109BA
MKPSEDQFDAALVRALQQDGRASIQTLADELEASRAQVSSRLRRLLDDGTVRVVAAVDPGFLGHSILTHNMLRVSGSTEHVTEQLRARDETVFVSAVSGADHVVFETRFGSTDAMLELLQWVRSLEGVERVSTTTYIRIVRGFFVANYRGDYEPDDIDRKLITLLEGDGRRSYTALAGDVGMQPSSVRERVNRLIEQNVIRISAVEARGVVRGQLGVGVGITSRGDDEQIAEFLATNKAVDFAAQSYGRHDFIATIVGPNPRSVFASIEALRALPATAAVESWTHLHVVKEDYARTLRPAEL